MTRRDWLRQIVAGLAGTAVASTFDLDRLLWVPGERTIFVPPLIVAPSVPSTLLTIDMITDECLRILKNSLTLADHVNLEYDKYFNVVGPPFQTTIRTRRPRRPKSPSALRPQRIS